MKAKKEEQKRRDAKLSVALSKAKKQEKAADTGSTKRKTNAFLSCYLELSLESRCAIRSEELFSARSYNLSKQVIALIDHLFVRYPVPLFLYRTMLSTKGIELVFGDARVPRGEGKNAEYAFRPWFLAVTRGDSFAKVAKDVLTKREAHWFLQAPCENRISQNIFWAKAATAGLSKSGCDYLVQRLDARDIKRLGDRLPDLLRFYAEAWPVMREYDRDEISDFIRAAIENESFSFKGRTLGSMRKLCRDWHRTLYTGSVRIYRSWLQMIPAWEHRAKGQVVRAVELTNNRALADEGKNQRHCVYTYEHACLQKRSRIVSMRWFAVASRDEPPTHELARLTIEIWPQNREIVQIRGKLNRRATEEEMKAVRLWAGEHGLTIGMYA